MIIIDVAASLEHMVTMGRPADSRIALRAARAARAPHGDCTATAAQIAKATPRQRRDTALCQSVKFKVAIGARRHRQCTAGASFSLLPHRVQHAPRAATACGSSGVAHTIGLGRGFPRKGSVACRAQSASQTPHTAHAQLENQVE